MHIETMNKVKAALDGFDDDQKVYVMFTNISGHIHDHLRSAWLTASGTKLVTNDFNKAGLLNKKTSDIAFLINQVLVSLSIADQDSAFQISFLPFEINKDKIISFVTEKDKNPLGLDKAMEAAFPETYHPLPDRKMSSAGDRGLVGPTPEPFVPVPDFFASFDMLNGRDILSAMNDEKRWQITDKIRATGQHAIKRVDDTIHYQFSFAGIISAEDYRWLVSKVNAVGKYETITFKRKGEGSASYTIVSLVRKMNSDEKNLLSI